MRDFFRSDSLRSTFYALLILLLIITGDAFGQAVPGGGGAGTGGGTGCDSTAAGTSVLKGDGAGGCVAAVDGTDIITPNGALGTPASVTLTNATGLPISTGVSGLGTGVATFLGTPTSANLAAAVTNETGSGALVFATSPTLVSPVLGTPASVTLTNATGLPISTGVSGLGTGVATFLGTPTSANLAAAVTNETGSGALVFATSPTLVTPILGTPTSVTLTNATGLPLTTGVTGVLPAANIATAILDGSVNYGGASSGGTDTYAATLSPAPVGYVTGAQYCFTADVVNTGTASVNFNSLGAKTIVKNVGGVNQTLSDNDIRAGIICLRYNGTNMVLQSPLGNAAGGGSALTVREEDGSPSDSAVATIRVPNGSLSINSAGDVSISIAGAGDVTAASTFGTDNSLIRSDGTGKGVQATGSLATVDDSGVITAAGFVSQGATSGSIALSGSTSGSATITVAAAAGTPAALQLPTATGAANAVLITDGGSPQVLNWQASTGSGNFVRAGSPTFTGSPVLASPSATTITAQVFQSTAADPADTGVIRLGNAELICWELATPGTDKCIALNSSDAFTVTSPWNVPAGGTGLSSGTSGGIPYFSASTTIASSAALTANMPVIGGGAGVAPSTGTVSGNTTVFVTTTGTQTSGNCVSIDASGNHIAAGISCGGSITVQEQDASPLVTGVTTIKVTNGTLTDDGGGIVSISTGGGGGSGCVPSGAAGQLLTDDGAGACTSQANISVASSVLTTTASGKVNLGSSPATDGLKVPTAAGAAPTADGQIAFDSTAHFPVFGSNGSTVYVPSGNSSGQALTAVALTATLNVAGGGSGATSLTGILKGNGTSPFSAATAGTDYTSPNSSETFTNKTYDAEGTGNVLGVPRRVPWTVAGCNGTTAGPVFDLPASSAPVPVCVINAAHRAALEFADSANLTFRITTELPATWDNSKSTDFRLKWNSSVTSGDVQWFVETACSPAGATMNPSFNSANSVITTVAGTTNFINFSSITGLTMTGCSAGDLITLRISRDSTGGNTNDTLAGTANLIAVGLVYREAI